MIRNSITAVMLLMIGSLAQSQELDSMVLYSDLTYLSIFEEMIFSKIEKGEEIALADLYLAVSADSESDANRQKDKLNALISSLKRSGSEGKKEKKKVKVIYEEVHASLMVKYEEEAYFPDLFKNGNFNCVTGSMVYSLVFSEFDIPYSIQKGMNHVNLVAFPETHTILVESTDSEEGLKAMDKNAKSAYVDQLSRGKLITPEQRTQGNITSIFMQYALSESDIDEYELASYQYFNRGVFLVKELNYEEAHKAFEKAYYLKPGLELAGMLLQTSGLILHQSDYSKPEHVKLICKIARFKEFGITDDDVLGEFGRITQKIFYDREDAVMYESAFNILISDLKSKELVEKISLSYYAEVIESLINEGDFRGSLQYIDELYELGKDNKRILTSIKDILISYLVSANMVAPDQVAFMDRYRAYLPEVFEMPMMKLIDVSTLVSAADYYFSREDPVKGNQSLELFEQRVDGIGNLNMVAGEIESAYELAAFYYYDRGNRYRTRLILDRGLKILPQSHRLKYLKSSI